MNNKFTLNANGIKKDAEMIVKFNLENKDYLIYCTDENESNHSSGAKPGESHCA